MFLVSVLVQNSVCSIRFTVYGQSLLVHLIWCQDQRLCSLCMKTESHIYIIIVFYHIVHGLDNYLHSFQLFSSSIEFTHFFNVICIRNRLNGCVQISKYLCCLYAHIERVSLSLVLGLFIILFSNKTSGINYCSSCAPCLCIDKQVTDKN